MHEKIEYYRYVNLLYLESDTLVYFIFHSNDTIS